MPYPKCKIYSDGGHYIAIPHTTRPYRPRKKPKEEVITVTEEVAEETQQPAAEQSAPSTEDAPMPLEETVSDTIDCTEIADTLSEKTTANRLMTKKELFEKLYARYQSLPRYKRKAAILKRMRHYFSDAEAARLYVETNTWRKTRNLIARRVRMVRKINLQAFNYFVTFIYNSELHTEESFRKKLKSCLSHFCTRKSWKYVGVWERSPEKKRLHFHGIFHIPDGTMPGMMLEVADYNFKAHRRVVTHQNSYFNEAFGRSDFEPLDARSLGSAIAYIVKYLEKTGEKIVYSKGLPQYFVSDVMDEDVVCPFGLEDKKLLLYDDFLCWDEGVLVGAVSKAVISQMPKAN
mgnify:CR=1 FL=1